MIFTSNRTRRFWADSIYTTQKRVNNNWTTPVNFGAEINTSSDEYRPFPFEIGGKNVDDFFFKSERVEKVDFDLYAVRAD
jgi:hypothetical protein